MIDNSNQHPALNHLPQNVMEFKRGEKPLFLKDVLSKKIIRYLTMCCFMSIKFRVERVKSEPSVYICNRTMDFLKKKSISW